MRSGPASVTSDIPAATRSTRLVTRSTMTSPRRPWGLTTRPTSRSVKRVPGASVGDVDGHLDALTGTRGAHDGADGLGHAAPPADDLAHVVRGDMQRQVDAATALIHLHN